MYRVGDFYESPNLRGIVVGVTAEQIEVETVNDEGDVENIFIENNQ